MDPRIMVRNQNYLLVLDFLDSNQKSEFETWGVCVIPPEGNELTIFAILLLAPLNVNTGEAGGVT